VVDTGQHQRSGKSQRHRIGEMTLQDILPVLTSIAVIILERQSRLAAAITATMPLTAPLALWIVYSSANGDRASVTQFSLSMLLGIIPSAGFIRHHYPILQIRRHPTHQPSARHTRRTCPDLKVREIWAMLRYKREGESTPRPPFTPSPYPV